MAERELGARREVLHVVLSNTTDWAGSGRRRQSGSRSTPGPKSIPGRANKFASRNDRYWRPSWATSVVFFQWTFTIRGRNSPHHATLFRLRILSNCRFAYRAYNRHSRYNRHLGYRLTARQTLTRGPGNTAAKRVRSNWASGAENFMTPRIFRHRRRGFRCRRIGVGPPSCAWVACVLLSGILAVLAAAVLPRAAARHGRLAVDRTVPTQTYHAAFADFYDGDYRSALERFEAEARGSIKIGQSRWIDSICYETMQGECYYQMGAYPDALAHYTAALELFQAYPTWLSQVVFQPIRADPGAKKPPPWQVRRLQAPLGQVPYTMSSGRGRSTSRADQAGRGHPAAQPVSHRAARDRALHGVGHPPPRRVARSAGRPRSGASTTSSPSCSVGPDSPTIGRTRGSTWNWGWPCRPAGGRPRPFRSCNGPRWPRASWSIR